jgi:hypothetical protein
MRAKLKQKEQVQLQNEQLNAELEELKAKYVESQKRQLMQ